MTNQGKIASLYYKELSVFNFDDKFLQISKKKSMLRNLISKKAKRINKKNIHYLMKDDLK